MLQLILLAAAVVLLLVVFVPVGVALYQRMKPSRSPERNAERRTEPVPPLPAGPTTKLPAIQADVTPKPKPKTPPAAEPKVSSTRLITPEEVPGHQATEAVVWFGMLRCTAGPLEGQTFIIEEDGLYIGRDPSLAKIVIDDSRVSKRHLRIVPRDGKVWAIDQNSTNGTFLVNTAGRERITEHQLKRGESIVLADDAATFMYQI